MLSAMELSFKLHGQILQGNKIFFTPFTKTTPGRLWRQRGINEAKLIFVHYKRKPLEEPHFEMDIEHAANPL